MSATLSLVGMMQSPQSVCPRLDTHLKYIRLTRLLWPSFLFRKLSDCAEEERVKAPPAFASAERGAAAADAARLAQRSGAQVEELPSARMSHIGSMLDDPTKDA